MCVCLFFVCVPHACIAYRDLERGPDPGTGVIGCCEQPDVDGSWELNLGPLKNQQGLLTTEAFPQFHV